MIKGRLTFNRNGLRYKIEAAAKKQAVQVTQKLVNGCIKDSPVFTGSFRASWNVSEGSPIYLIGEYPFKRGLTRSTVACT